MTRTQIDRIRRAARIRIRDLEQQISLGEMNVHQAMIAIHEFTLTEISDTTPAPHTLRVTKDPKA